MMQDNNMESNKYEFIGRQLATDANWRKSIWVKFVKGIKKFKMINIGDKIAVCIS